VALAAVSAWPTGLDVTLLRCLCSLQALLWPLHFAPSAQKCPAGKATTVFWTATQANIRRMHIGIPQPVEAMTLATD